MGNLTAFAIITIIMYHYFAEANNREKAVKLRKVYCFNKSWIVISSPVMMMIFLSLWYLSKNVPDKSVRNRSLDGLTSWSNLGTTDLFTTCNILMGSRHVIHRRDRAQSETIRREMWCTTLNQSLSLLYIVPEKTPPANEPAFSVYVSGESLSQKKKRRRALHVAQWTAPLL